MKILPASPLTLPLALLIGVSLFFLCELNAQTTAPGAVAGAVTYQTLAVITEADVVMNTDGPNSTGMNFSILGMPSTSYLYSIDGVDNPATGVLGLMLGQNQIQEATVVSTGYSGQFGNAAGGNINYITKSGSNQFHGNAQYYWNGRVLNANNLFNNAFGFPRPFDIANQWAGSFGGPIKKDRLFFFFDMEGLRVLIPSIAQVLIASPEFQA